MEPDSLRGRFVTPLKLINMYPLTKAAKWEANVIGTFRSTGLAKGKYNNTKHWWEIELLSFNELMDFYDSLPYGFEFCRRANFKNGVYDQPQFYTASELIEKYPIVKKAGWSYVKIGMLLRAGLLYGFHSSGEDCNLIEELSFLALMRYYDSVQAKALNSHLDPDEPPIRFFDDEGNILPG